MKKFYILFAILVSMLSMSTSTFAQGNEEIKVFVKGLQLKFDVPPQMQNGRTLVPLRVIFEALGALVDWNDSTQTITGIKENTKIILKLNSTTVTVNDNVITLDVPATTVNGRTLVPVRFISEALGMDVKWDDKEKKVIIDNNMGGTSTDRVSVSKEVYTTGVVKIIDGDAFTLNSDKTTTIEFKNGDKYVGEINSDNKPHGKGTYSYNSIGRVYTGEFANGVRNGYGVSEYVSGERKGNKYEGYFLNDIAHGKCKYSQADGLKYVGDILNDKFTGDGEMTYPDGSIYKGQFLNDSPDGQGTYIFEDGSKYVGEWKRGNREGSGTFTTTDHVYIGEWKNDKANGSGILTYANGVKLIGEFRDNQYITTQGGNNLTPTTTNTNKPSTNTTTTTNTTPPVNTAFLAEQKRQFEQAISDIQTQIANAQNEKSAKVLVTAPDGTSKWEFQADQRIIQPLQERLKAKQNEYNLWKAANGQ